MPYGRLLPGGPGEGVHSLRKEPGDERAGAGYRAGNMGGASGHRSELPTWPNQLETEESETAYGP